MPLHLCIYPFASFNVGTQNMILDSKEVKEQIKMLKKINLATLEVGLFWYQKF